MEEAVPSFEYRPPVRIAEPVEMAPRLLLKAQRPFRKASIQFLLRRMKLCLMRSMRLLHRVWKLRPLQQQRKLELNTIILRRPCIE